MRGFRRSDLAQRPLSRTAELGRDAAEELGASPEPGRGKAGRKAPHTQELHAPCWTEEERRGGLPLLSCPTLPSLAASPWLNPPAATEREAHCPQDPLNWAADGQDGKGRKRTWGQQGETSPNNNENAFIQQMFTEPCHGQALFWAKRQSG